MEYPRFSKLLALKAQISGKDKREIQLINYGYHFRKMSVLAGMKYKRDSKTIMPK
jgi:hypothetical protein